jgi:hypothetical protein
MGMTGKMTVVIMTATEKTVIGNVTPTRTP